MDLKKPFGRALQDFESLTPGEQQLLDACAKGKAANLGSAAPESATDQNQVRAAFIRFLLLGGDEQAPVHERGVYLRGAFIEGVLDLGCCHIVTNVSLTHCRFANAFNASDARLNGLLNLQGSYLAHGLRADRLRCAFSVFLRNGFQTMGEVRLLGAQIGGSLSCSGGLFEVADGSALSADGAEIKGGVSLADGFKATGAVRLLGAHIGGNLNCSGGRFEMAKGGALFVDGARVRGDVSMGEGFEVTGEVRLLGAQIGGDLDCRGGLFKVEEGHSLSADRAKVEGNVTLSGGFKAEGAVRLLGAQIGGTLDCSDGQFEFAEGSALSADRMTIKGGIFLADGFKAKGEVRLLGVKIGGNLSCMGGQFEGAEGCALSVDRAEVKGSVFLSTSFNAKGEVRLLGVQIGGSLNCSGGQFEVEKGDALSADGAEVKGGVVLDHGFKATGEVRLLGMQIGGNLSCRGGHFEAREGDALTVEGAEIKGSVLLDGGFRATGEVSLSGAQVGGSLSCREGRFKARDGVALSLQSIVVRGTWFLCGLPQPVSVNAAHANVAVLVDDLAAWGPGSVLDGLNYASFGGQAPTSGAERLEWLHRQSKAHLGDTDGSVDFRPQPWRQMQRVLREMGHIEDAKLVGIALQDRLRAIGRIGQWPKDICDVPRCLKGMVTRSAHFTFGKLAGYGYRPADLVSWMFAVWLVCGAAYWWLALPPQSAIAPSEPLVFQSKYSKNCQPDPDPDPLDASRKPGNWYLCTDLPGEYSTFSPFAFSLDLLLPVVDLGQEKAWGAFIPTPKEKPWEELVFHWHWGHAVRILTWFQTLFGWVCSLLLVAIVSGYSRRNDEGV